MSRLFVVVRPFLAQGFHLAGVDTHSAPDIDTAEELIGEWLDAGETGLVAIDDGLLAYLDEALVRRLDASRVLHHISIPGGEPLEGVVSRRQRIAELLRRAIGFHIVFDTEEIETEKGQTAPRPSQGRID